MSEIPSHDVTRLLTRWKRGDEQALHELVPIVYDELRRLAHYHLQSERPDHTLSTALVHEAYVRLIGSQQADLQNREHFMAVASRLMRQVLVDYARTRNAAKRDGGCRVSLDQALEFPMESDEDLLALKLTQYPALCSLYSRRRTSESASVTDKPEIHPKFLGEPTSKFYVLYYRSLILPTGFSDRLLCLRFAEDDADERGTRQGSLRLASLDL